MNCDTCQALLVDLASGELTEDVREAATAHAQQCERCGHDLATLKSGLGFAARLEMLPVPAGVRDHVLAAARAHVAERESHKSAARASRSAWWRQALSRFGELATSPQVAMATVLLLMIAVGLYYLPAAEAPQAELGPLGIDAEPSPGAPAPSATATAFPPEEPQLQEEAKAEQEAPSEDRAEADAPARERKRRSAGRGGLGGLNKPRAQREKRIKGTIKPAAVPRSAPSKAKKRSASPSRRTEPAAFPGLDSEDADDRAPARSGGSEGSALRTRDEASMEMAEQATGAAPSPSAVATQLLTQATREAASGRHAEAARLAERALAQGGSDAARTHWVAAQSYRALGKCQSAVPHYAEIRRTTKRYPLAWIEGALCLRKLGDAATADEWLREAQRIPAVAERATALRGGERPADSKEAL